MQFFNPTWISTFQVFYEGCLVFFFSPQVDRTLSYLLCVLSMQQVYKYLGRSSAEADLSPRP